ncbi:unnamed protein product [Sphagnum troendelagicum]|uniref:Uncharacterized protein n=1 Tax=Sphagnum troendelagicum TaxID=128251 RepID=A0ABP0UCH6_9BRYO
MVAASRRWCVQHRDTQCAFCIEVPCLQANGQRSVVSGKIWSIRILICLREELKRSSQGLFTITKGSWASHIYAWAAPGFAAVLGILPAAGVHVCGGCSLAAEVHLALV